MGTRSTHHVRVEELPMSCIRKPVMSVLVPILAVPVTAASCRANADASENASALSKALSNAQSLSSSGDQDPCTLLSAAEASRYVGALSSPPYRASDVHPDPKGDACIYRGTNGRQLAIRPVWRGGRMMGRVLTGIPNALGGMLGKGAPGLDTLTHRVMQQGPTGPWDQATWIPGGTLTVTKSEATVQIDMSGASGQESDALAIARLAVPRIGHPLHYDGAKAVALAPKPKAHPNGVCDVLPRSAVEAAIGPLSGTPVSNPDGSTCTYRVATEQGERSYPVGITWEGGAQSYNMLKHGMSTMGGLLGTPTTTPMDTVKPDSKMGQMLGGFMKMATGASATSATGAVATEGVRTDTTLKGPWDSAMLLHGTQLMAVKGDVAVAIDLQSADYEKAKALLSALCTRL